MSAAKPAQQPLECREKAQAFLPEPGLLLWGCFQNGGDCFREQRQAQALEPAHQEPTAELDALVLQPVSTHDHGNFPPSKRLRKHLVRVIPPSV